MVREGWDKRGARSRLDRRRTVKEAVKRRAVQARPAPFTNDDLRFRQLVRQPRPSSNAVVFFVLDVSSSMTQAERRLAKTFFFFLALRGLRKKSGAWNCVFWPTRRARGSSTRATSSRSAAWAAPWPPAASAWRVAAGGTLRPGSFNSYLFYASDGDNFSEDRSAASATLGQLAALQFHGLRRNPARHAARPGDRDGTVVAGTCTPGLAGLSAVLGNGDDVFAALRMLLRPRAGRIPDQLEAAQ